MRSGSCGTGCPRVTEADTSARGGRQGGAKNAFRGPVHLAQTASPPSRPERTRPINGLVCRRPSALSKDMLVKRFQAFASEVPVHPVHALVGGHRSLRLDDRPFAM